MRNDSSGRKRGRTAAAFWLASAGVSAVVLAITFSAHAQSSPEAAKSLPETTISGEPAAPPAAESAPSDTESAPAPHAHPAASKSAVHHRSRRKSAAVAGFLVEPANAMLKLNSDAWAYSRPAASSSHVERVHAGKFVKVTGSTRYYVQVKLKSGKTAYVPIKSVELTRPADKVFRLTKDTAVLSAPSRYGRRLAEVHNGHDVHIVGTAMNYMKIRMKDGLEGYISSTALE